MYSLARILMILGIVLLALGGLVYLIARSGVPIGRLPGDFRFQWGNVTCLFPLATSILVSVILTILINIFLRVVGRK